MTSTRIPALNPPYAPNVRAQLRRAMPPGLEPIGLFRTLARNLEMLRAMHGWGAYELSRRLSGWYHAIGFVGRAARVPHETGTPRFVDLLPVGGAASGR